MGFICPECGKDFGINKEWFYEHIELHSYRIEPIKRIIIQVEEQKATLKSISNSIKADRIRVWMDYNGKICFENSKTKNKIDFDPYYDMDGEKIDY